MEAEKEKTGKSMTEVKTEILEIVINSPVAVDKDEKSLVSLLEKSATFIFKYKPNDYRD